LPQFMAAFHEVNNYLWDKFNHGHIDRMELRNERFNLILSKFGVNVREIPKGMGEKYLEVAPIKSRVIPDTFEILEYLKPNYQLHIISNGFDDVQHIKLNAAKIHHYFDKIVTSDSSNFRKPQREIFEFALKVTGASLENALMIGDNIDTDILGAQNAEMDHVFFNPGKIKHSLQVNYEVETLSQIMNIL
jgi:putative hydrolase of the HAD superfamily